MIRWYMVPEIWCATDGQTDRQTDRWKKWHIKVSAPPKNQNFQKLKKTHGDIITLHKCTKNHDHMLYCSWCMVYDRCNYFSFWAIFCSFTTPPPPLPPPPTNSPKNQNFEKTKKKPGDSIILHKCIKNHDHMLYCSWYMVRDKCNY